MSSRHASSRNVSSQSPAKTGEKVAQQAEPICACGCGRYVGSCVWEPSAQRLAGVAALAARVDRELLTRTGRFAC